MKKIIFLFIITFMSSTFAMEQSKEEALFNAIERNDLNAVKNLIAHGVEINEIDKNDDTPLMLAVKQKNINIIKEILNEVPNLDTENKENKTAMEIAQMLPENSEQAKKLKNDIIALLKLAEIQDDFDYAVREGRLDIDNIAQLINAGASVNIPRDKRNPLFNAIRQGELKLVKLLIQHGADVNQRLKDVFPSFPLLYAVGSKYGSPNSTPAIIKVLLENGANPNIVGDARTTPLISASMGGNVDAVQLLLKAGADPSKKEMNGKTALYWAQAELNDAVKNLAKATTESAKKSYQEKKQNYEDVIKLLQGKTISADRENLLKALEQADINTLKKLIPEFFGIQYALNLAIQENYLAGISAILNMFGSDLRKEDKDGNTKLMFVFNKVIKDRELSAVNLLINYGVDVNKANNVGKTPLMTAAEYSTPAIVQILLQKGANPNVKGGYKNQTPLMYAIEAGNFDVIEPLLNGQADPLIKDARGKDALDIAKMALNQASREAVRGRRFQQKKQNYEKIVKLLESKIPPAILEQKREQERQKQAAKEQARQQEAARLAQEEANRQEQERQRQAQAERDRLAREAEEAQRTAEQVRLVQEEIARQAERVAEQERQRQAQAERDRLVREAEEAQKIEERLRQEQLARERREQERLEQQKREHEREQERLRAAQERLERERLAANGKLLLSALHNLTQTFNQIQRFL